MKNPLVEPYLFFGGRCEEAIEFYRAKLGAEVKLLMRYGDSPESVQSSHLAPGSERKIMYANLLIGGSRVMACDDIRNPQAFAGFSLSLSYSTPAEATRAFEALAEGGAIVMPIGKTFWSPCFGMVTDRFGILWMVTVIDQPAG